ncbi:hypothetical protein KR018_012261, partial [Drosophila ironensis]
MELPSMVKRAGDCLVVRSLVSGKPVYQTPLAKGDEGLQSVGMGPDLLDRQCGPFKFFHSVMSTLQTSIFDPEGGTAPAAAAASAATDGAPLGNEEELPQCKIRRNYSCNQCAFFTQNPRSHLSHLRDVHGEKIVINECKLCLYASRHFQKLVRHMKMVHGCSDDGGAPGSNGQSKGKRNLTREARKRRLEESIEVPVAAPIPPALDANLVKMLQNGPSLDQLKAELQHHEQELLTTMQKYNRQQEMQQLQTIVDSHDNIFSMAFEFQVKMMPPAQSESSGSSGGTSLKMDGLNNSSSDSEEASQSPGPEVVELAPGVQQYQCHKCTYSTPIRSRFKKHVKYHSMPLIKCSSCDFHSPYKWNLDRHTKNHGAEGHFRCSVCNFSTDIKQSLTIHELNHHVPTVGHQMASRRRAPEASQDQPGQMSVKPGCSGYRRQDMDKGLTGPVTAPDSPRSDLSGLSCMHCQVRMTSATDLFKHMQSCVQRNGSLNALGGDTDAGDEDFPHASNEFSYCGVETAPGYGEVTDHFVPDDNDDLTPLKKVFKCPHCSFWAATASRFHVHIVGHLNRKPFECSLCAYRSNWRWDITKHIRLKAMRDKTHNQAEVLMNDETGRRNYAKYNQYLTLMKVTTEQLADPKAMRTGEMIVMPPEPME